MKILKDKVFWGAVMSLLIVSNVNGYALENQKENVQAVIKNETMIVKQSGWVEKDGDFYYYVDGKPLIEEWIELHGYKYYLNINGIMECNKEARIYDAETGRSYTYRFDASGHMITGWFTNKDGNYKYYDNDGKLVQDKLKTINNKKYYFHANGNLIVDKYVFVNNQLYKAEKSGECNLAADGYHDDNYYVENGSVVVGWKYLNNKWYYFNEATGRKVRDTVEYINDECYSFDSNGALQYGWIKLEGNRWSYAKPNGALVYNSWFNDGHNSYYFNETEMVTGVFYIDGKNYLFNNSGKLMGKLDNNKTGWILDGNRYFYVEDGQAVSYDFKRIGGKLYYFDELGVMAANEAVEDYYFGSNGAAVSNAWILDEFNNYRYYDENGQVVRDSWKLINNIWYYFVDEIMCTSEHVIDGTIHRFRENGSWIGGTQQLKSGWYLIDGQYYYYEDGEYATDIKVINGKKYHFNYEGIMSHSTIINTNDNSYYADKSGALASGWCNNGRYYASPIDNSLVDGLNIINNKKYYFVSKELMYNDTISEDGSELYIIDRSGAVQNTVKANGTGWYLSSNGKWYYQYKGSFVVGKWLIGGKFYVLNDSGEMMVDQLVHGAGYVDANGILRTTGWYENYYLPLINEGHVDYDIRDINNKKYYFIEGQSVDGVFFVDGNNYYYDGNGNRTLVNFKEGWNKINSDWYYVSNGSVVRSEYFYDQAAVKVGNQYYYFGYDGKMIANQLMYSWDNKVITRYVDANGVVVKSRWVLINGDYYYFNAKGHALTGTHTIGSVVYTFDEEGIMV